LSIMKDQAQNELVVVLGGARSGKSSWALRYAAGRYQSYIFLATAQALDEEMAARIEIHKAARGPAWALIEEPIELAEALRSRCGAHQVIVVDCLTLWLSNVLLEKGETQVHPYLDRVAEALRERKQAVVAVSNEVGMGLVPDNRIGRQFRDLAGEMNQKVAALADKVVFMAAGIPLFLKGGPQV
jgi:adenosylcobinamide kinase/adenosylcobinamide-phosphate guanylyltransferase